MQACLTETSTVVERAADHYLHICKRCARVMPRAWGVHIVVVAEARSAASLIPMPSKPGQSMRIECLLPRDDIGSVVQLL